MAEAPTPAPAKSPEPSAPPPASGFLSGTRAWIILISAVALEAVLFSAILYFKDKQKTNITPGTTAVSVEEEVYSHYFPIKDLTYSIPTPPTGTATLTMEIGIRLGRTEEEKQKGEDLTPEEWAQFDNALRSLEPAIRDKLNGHIYQQTINELNSPNGREKIKDVVKDFVNGELERLNILKNRKTPYAKRRVAAVLIPNYYIQQ